MKLAICDDDSVFAEHLASLCRKCDLVKDVCSYLSPEHLYLDIKAGMIPDAILMDIDFGEKHTGIDYAAKLHTLRPDIRIIYITGYTSRFVQQIFFQPSNLLGFIIKPVQPDILFPMLQKLQNALDTDKQNILYISGKGNATCVPANSILYLESVGHLTYVYTVAETHSIRKRLTMTLESLPSNFLQCHKSYAVNMDYITEMHSNELVIHDSFTIPVSKSRSRTAKECYFNYIHSTL